MPVDQTDSGFQHLKQYLQDIGGFGDPEYLKQGVLGVINEGGEVGPTHYHNPNVSGDAFAGGLYDDEGPDYDNHPYAYPEHPDFRKWWEGNLDGIVDRKEQPETKTTAAKPTASDPAPAPEPDPVFSSSQAGFSSSTPAVTALSQQSGFVPTATPDPSDPSAPKPEPIQSFVTQLREDLGTDPEAQALESFILKARRAAQKKQDQESIQNLAIETIKQINPGFLAEPVEAPKAVTEPESVKQVFDQVADVTRERDVLDELTEAVKSTDFVDVIDPIFGEEVDDPLVNISDDFEGFFKASEEEEAIAATQSSAFATQDAPTASLFGGPITTPADIARAEAEGKNTLGMELSRSIDLFSEKLDLAIDETTAKTIGGQVLSQVGKDTVEGFVLGAVPGINPFVATGLGTVAFGVGLTAAQIASSTYSGFTTKDFLSALINNIVPFADFFGIGTSPEDMENQQEQDDLAIEGIFSMPGTEAELEGQLAKLAGRNLENKAIRSEKEIRSAIDQAEAIFLDERNQDKEIFDVDPAAEAGSEGIGGPTADVAFSEASMGIFGFDDDFGDYGGEGEGEGEGEGDDGGGSACWVAGTQILMANNTYRNIEDLKIGDMVMSYPETKKTRRWNTPLEAKPIVSLLVDVHPEIWHLNDSMVSGTEWMIKGDGTAAIVQWLNIGDIVLGPNNNLVEITRVEPAEGRLKKQVIYNFETEDNYTYIADGMRTIRGRAVRGEQWGKAYLSGDTNSYEGSMKDEYVRKFNKIKNAA